MEFYRYIDRQYSDGYDDNHLSSLFSSNLKVELMTFNLHKETPKGYWIGYGHITEGGLRSTSRWVAKYGKKRYAYPTKKEALRSFRARKKQQVRILGNQLRTAKMALLDAESMLKTQKSLD